MYRKTFASAIFCLIGVFTSPVFAGPTCVLIGHHGAYSAPLFDLRVYGDSQNAELASALNLEDAVKSLNAEVNAGHCVRSENLPVCTLGDATTGSKYAVFLVFDTVESSRELLMVTVPWSANHSDTSYFQDRVASIIQLRDQIASVGLCKLDPERSFFSFETGVKGAK